MIRDDFLKAYKEVENDLALFNKDVLTYENTLVDSAEGNKLKLCRMIRNYLQHNNDQNFVEPTKYMVLFLENLHKKLVSNTNTNAKEMIKLVKGKTQFDIKDKLEDILPSLAKYKIVLIYDKGEFKGIYSADTYLRFLSKNKVLKSTKISAFDKYKKICVPKDKQYDDTCYLLENNKLIFVTETGNDKEPILGYIINELF